MFEALTAKSAIVVDHGPGKVLYGKNQHARLPNASTTKVLSAIIASRELDPFEKVRIRRAHAEVPNTVLACLSSYDVVRAADLMHLMLMQSDNGAALALAENACGSVFSFVREMNVFAKSIGCRSTSFKNPHGLPEVGHVSSSQDLSIIARHAVKSRTISEIAAKASYAFSTERCGRTISVSNTNPLLAIEGFRGLKTGWSNESGYCLIGLFSRPDQNGLVTVVLGCPTRQASVRDTLALASEYAPI